LGKKTIMVNGVLELAYIFLATFIVSLISFVGVVSLALNDKILNKILLILIGLSAGALMGGAFLHLLPEAVEKSDRLDIYFLVLVGFILFFLVEKVLHWRHCHKGQCDVHTFHYMNLVGDSLHNFIDGLIMAASFVVSLPLGITTTIAIAAHEIPQEIGDFGVLIYPGYSKSKALLSNFIIALTAFLGALIILVWGSQINGISGWLLPFTAGGFIYIAGSDLIPELHKETQPKKSLMQLVGLILGVAIMLVIK